MASVTLMDLEASLARWTAAQATDTPEDREEGRQVIRALKIRIARWKNPALTTRMAMAMVDGKRRRTMKLSDMVSAKLARQRLESLVCCAQHGARGGAFIRAVWANGETMVSVPGTTGAQAITAAQFDALKAAGWKILV